ncbi:uncharacterized protein EV422DRAFT_532891 [Fimicolochytrium jonesii]|uniref:uncharacterized protein n=1 Tax=Fimicolochytrium jonesii TaxID=1396493 RepID=UPI0022FEC1FE|nr:uncharacterized protein EV422DRAFT_532891 [Fimicolochytrium jonesii]KAI8819941.1 hypothetical protein EV422DRAFT_532891 [Fimicolochytrium jonesii]
MPPQWPDNVASNGKAQMSSPQVSARHPPSLPTETSKQTPHQHTPVDKMSALCPHITSTTLATPSSEVFKEECTLCFDTQDMEAGVDVCLTCFNGGCAGERNHAKLHFEKTGHAVVLNVRRVPKTKDLGDERPKKMTKLEIVEENEDDMFEVLTVPKCLKCGGVEIERSVGKLPAVIDSVVTAMSAKRQSEVKAWQEEIVACRHTEGLVQDAGRKLEASNLAHCTSCPLPTNLWLCLTCGNLGCGRQQVGGLGGNSHGLAHHDATRHPVAVKLGTITPEGGADVFCYECGEDRLDAKLAAHLATWGINVAEQQKTEKSLGELQLEQNMKFDFSMTTQDGKSLDPLFGPGFTGLKNLGNSCYMASVMQTVFALKPFEDRYTTEMQSHVLTCTDRPAHCFHCQMAKLADGLLSGRYSRPQQETVDAEGEKKAQNGIAPGMFKNLVGKGHVEFSTMRQQDAQEFFQHLLTLTEQKHRTLPGADPSKIFQFGIEQRLQCLECHQVRYKTEKSSSLTLRVPTGDHGAGGEKEGEGGEKGVEFEACLATFFGDDVREYKCPHDKADVSATFTTRFSTFPDVLVCTMSRFVLGKGWVMEKLNVPINAPLGLDLERLRGHGLQSDEVELPEDTQAPTPAAPQVDPEALAQLVAMGFPEVRCIKALVKTGNAGAEVAMGWLFEHMEDADIDDPITAPSASGPSEADIRQLVDMGFSAAQAKRALKETSGNLERAVDYLFSHADSMDIDDDATTTATTDTTTTAPDTRPARYRLTAFISHRGTSTHCGHYVAHIRRRTPEGEEWALFNDNHVVSVPERDVQKAVGEAYIYVYERV